MVELPGSGERKLGRAAGGGVICGRTVGGLRVEKILCNCIAGGCWPKSADLQGMSCRSNINPDEAFIDVLGHAGTRNVGRAIKRWRILRALVLSMCVRKGDRMRIAGVDKPWPRHAAC